LHPAYIFAKDFCNIIVCLQSKGEKIYKEQVSKICKVIHEMLFFMHRIF